MDLWDKLLGGPKGSYQPEIEFFSYARPSNDFWFGFGNALRNEGYSDEEIQTILESKLMRHGLDNFDLVRVGALFAKRVLKNRAEIKAVLREK